MMKAITITILVLVSIESFNQTIDRSVVSSTGDHIDSDLISVSWTLGEIAISPSSSDGLILSQGFHQGNLVINAIEGILSEFQLKTYPNPVLDRLIIESSKLNQYYEIFDVNGRVITNGHIDSSPFELDFTTLPSGSYFLIVESKWTHKIIKE